MSEVKRYRVSTLPGRLTRDCPEVVEACDYDNLRAEVERLTSVADAEMKLREGNFAEIERLRAALQKSEDSELLALRNNDDLRAKVERLRGAISELATAQNDIAQVDARGPDFKHYQRDITAARLRKAKAIIGLCAEARATGQQEQKP